jgi:Secretin and TonB N terminus short domain
MRLCITAGVLWMFLAVFAMADERKPTNIPAQGLAPALQALARDRSLQITYAPEEVGERRTLGAVGELNAQGALEQLLLGTGLTFEYLDDKTITIVPITSDVSTEENPPPPNTAQGLQPQAGIERAPLPQVTIEAQRELVKKRITHFVRTVTTQVSSIESLPRWGVKVCPAVDGLPESQGEFILQRVSTIARSAGVPLGAQDCRPNLWIKITAEPARLVKDMRSQFPASFMELSGQPATPTEIRRFIDDPRPIRAWYGIELVGALGNEMGTFDEMGDKGRAPKVNRLPVMSRARIDDLQTIESALVIVDRKRIEGLTVGAVADYAAMIGLAEVNPQGDYSSAESILKLFAAPDKGQSVNQPVNQLSAWDAAFLKALYATDQSSKLQVTTIVEKMTSDAAAVEVTPGAAHP